jgi:hypothetical protein
VNVIVVVTGWFVAERMAAERMGAIVGVIRVTLIVPGDDAPEVPVVVTVVMAVRPLGLRRQRTLRDDHLGQQRRARYRDRRLHRDSDHVGSVDHPPESKLNQLVTVQVEAKPGRSAPDPLDRDGRIEPGVEGELT